ncbi:MAG: hypothetical protein IJJ28_01735 [Lentisphaeria bacterium]|nr:hypothetical protein [Lentisphaeria bacterium]
MRALSPRQREVLEFLRNYSASHGMAPTIVEVAERFGIAAATAAGHLRALQKKHLLHRSGRARSIVLASGDGGNAVLKIPLYGNLNSPEIAENRHLMEGIVLLHRPATNRLSPEEFFALHVRDESMRDLGIFRNDVAIFAPTGQRPPRLGDVVAAFVGGGAVIRSYFRREPTGTAILRAAHPGIPDLELADREARLLGVLIALQREYPH